MSPHVSVGNESVPEAEAGAYHSDVDLTTSSSALGTNTTDVTNPSCHTHFVNGTCDVKTLLSVIADTLDFYFPPVLFVAGIICNALVVMVMQSRHFRHISTSFYMSITAGVDFASLLVSLPAHYLYVNFPEVCLFKHYFLNFVKKFLVPILFKDEKMGKIGERFFYYSLKI